MRYYIYLIVGFTLLAVSCEDVIELDLDTTGSKLVIEGFVTDQPGPYTIEISETTDFYNTNSFPNVRGATVEITDDAGHTDVLTEGSPGVYQTNNLQGKRGVTYTLTVSIDGNSYVATCKMPEKLITIDSITSKFEEESLFYEEGYYITAYFNDPVTEDNYGRFNIFVNGEEYAFEDDDEVTIDNNFWLWRDKFTEGNVQDYEFPHQLVPGDAVYLEFHHLDRATYDYYRTLVDVIDGGGVAPSNPISNFEGQDVLGYFGAFSVTTRSFIVQ